MPASIHVISPVAGFGSGLDLRMLSSFLEQNDFAVVSYPVRNRDRRARLSHVGKRVLSFRGRFDVNIFLAPIFPEWLPMARKNVLIPNVEGFSGHLHKWLPSIDLVLAKTRLTEQVFTRLKCRTEFTSFTSEDHLDEKVPRVTNEFLHTCSSQHKGTKRLIDLWRAHPEWPRLNIVVNNNETISAEMLEAPNIHAIRRKLSQAELIELQNRMAFHICCSECEGFGHYIMEAMSCRAVPFTTNAAPMNELVAPERGLLVGHLPDPTPMNLSHQFLFDPKSLEEKIEQARKLDNAAIARMGEAGRTFFHQNDAFFRRRFLEVIRSL